MTIKTRFRTRKEATAYLAKRGWKPIGKNYVGEMEYANLLIAGSKRRVTKLLTGQWRIDRV